jgi:hypothetical protein
VSSYFEKQAATGGGFRLFSAVLVKEYNHTNQKNALLAIIFAKNY